MPSNRLGRWGEWFGSISQAAPAGGESRVRLIAPKARVCTAPHITTNPAFSGATNPKPNIFLVPPRIWGEKKLSNPKHLLHEPCWFEVCHASHNYV